MSNRVQLYSVIILPPGVCGRTTTTLSPAASCTEDKRDYGGGGVHGLVDVELVKSWCRDDVGRKAVHEAFARAMRMGGAAPEGLPPEKGRVVDPTIIVTDAMYRDGDFKHVPRNLTDVPRDPATGQAVGAVADIKVQRGTMRKGEQPNVVEA